MLAPKKMVIKERKRRNVSQKERKKGGEKGA